MWSIGKEQTRGNMFDSCFNPWWFELWYTVVRFLGVALYTMEEQKHILQQPKYAMPCATLSVAVRKAQ